MEKRCKFNFLTTQSGTWIKKEDLLKHIDSIISTGHLSYRFSYAARKIKELKKEIEKCSYMDTIDKTY